jgi:hypothetical protein
MHDDDAKKAPQYTAVAQHYVLRLMPDDEPLALALLP